MERNSSALLENFCRTCMNGNKENKEIEGKAISIFSEAESMECKNITIMELLMLTTPQLNINIDDMLPKNVCESCLETLSNTYKFQKMCIRVEQTLREIVNEIPTQSQTNKDPLKIISNDDIDIIQSNVLTHFLKIEVDEPLIDRNETTFDNNSFIDDGEDIRCENGGDLMSNCDDFNEVDSHLEECEIVSNNAKSKEGNKIVKKNDAAVTKKQQSSDITKDYSKKSKTINNAIKYQYRNFKCGECGNCFTTRSSLNRHKRIHLRTVSLSQEYTLNKTEEDGSVHIQCDETKIRDVIEKEKQTSVLTKDSAKEFIAKTFIEDSEDMRFKIEESVVDNVDSIVDSEWPISYNNTKSNESHKMVKNKDVAITRQQQRSTEIIKDFTKKFNTRTNSKNVQSKNFKCDKCDKRYSTRTNLNRHKKKHFPTVGVSQENTLYKTVEDETINVECDERKIKDASEKKQQQTSETTNDSAKDSNAKTIDDSEDIRYGIEDSLREETVSISDVLGDPDNNIKSEWDILSNNTKSEIDNKIVKRNSKNVQSKNFKCDKCSNRYSKLSNLNRHKKMHIQTVRVSQECTVDKMEEDESINIKCDETKVNDVVEKEQQTSEITDDSTRVLNAEVIIEASVEDIRLEIGESRKEKDTSDSDESNNVDSDVDSEWAISSNNGNRNYECNICSNRYSVRSSLYRHTKKEHRQSVGVNHENTLYKAVEDVSINIKCDETEAYDDIQKEKQTSEITNDSTKEFNFKIISNNKNVHRRNFECNICGKRYSTRTNLNRHKKVHLQIVGVSQENTLYKDIGDESNKIKCYETKVNDDIQKEEQTSEITNDSTKCGKRLSSHKQLHLRSVKVDRRKSSVKRKTECGICQKVYKHPNALRVHLRIHTNECPYLCSECGKAFRTKDCFKQHCLRHGTERSYECPDCPKRFNCLSNLSSHKAVHNRKEKSHVCNICGAAFVQASLLKKHNMIHSGEKKYKCDYCDMRFLFADPCRRHMRIHTGEKPYKCKYCEKAYCQWNELSNHLRVHLGDSNVYQCKFCPLRFPTVKSVREHFTTHKNDDEETKVRNLSELNALEIKGRFVVKI